MVSLILMAVLKWADALPAYPDARQLCAEHVAAREMHIDWQSYAVADPVDKVSAFYAKALGAAGELDASGARSWHAPADANVVLTIAGRENDKIPGCSEKPRANEQTVIVVSRAIGAK